MSDTATALPEAPAPAAAKEAKLKPLPRPPGKAIRGGGTSATAKELFKYWLSLNEDQKNRLLVYVYRDRPKIDAWQLLTQQEVSDIAGNKKDKPEKNIAKWSECPVEDPDDWEAEMLHQFGAGWYHIVMNDTRRKESEKDLPKNAGNTICTAWVKDIGDYETHEPVLNYEHLVMAEPSNGSFITHCRIKGIRLPGDPPGAPVPTVQEEAEEMANTAVTEKLVDAFIEQQNRVTQRSDQQQERRHESPSADPGLVKITGDILKTTSDFMKDTMAASIKQGDPAEHTKQVMELAKAMQPPPVDRSSDSMLVQALMAQNAELQKSQAALQQSLMASLERRVELAEERARTAAAAPAAVPEEKRGIKQALEELRDMKGLIDELGGGGKETDDEPEEGGADKLAKYVPLLQAGSALLNGVGSSLYNFAVLVMKKGTPIPPGAEPAAIAAANPATAQPAAQPPDDGSNPMMHFVKAIEAELLIQLRAGGDGALFAAGLVQRYGKLAQDMYAELLTMGVDNTESMLNAYPPIGSIATQAPAEFRQFLVEFLDAPRVNAILTGQAPPQPPKQKATLRKKMPTPPAEPPQ